MAEEHVTHQLAAILYADVCGYSRLTEADEIGTHRQLSASLDLIADRIQNAGGEVVHYAGDAVLARFSSTVAATNCAISIQDAIGRLCAELDEDRRLLFRIGLNLGEVIVDRDDIYGDGVNIAARLESLAVPGGICVSDSVFQQVRDKVESGFDDIGDQNLRNIERPVKAYRVVLGSGTAGGGEGTSEKVLRVSRFSRITGPETEEEAADAFVRSEAPSIMILPFKNMSGDAGQDAFVDGFRLSIQSSLVKLAGLFLINAPASEHYRHSDVSPIQAGNEAGVRYVLDGAVQMAGDRIRVTIHLTDAPAGHIVWSETYDRVVDDVFEIQDEITTEVAVALEIKLVAGEWSFVWWENLPTRKTRELALRGLSHLYMGSPQGNATARSIFEEINGLLPDAPQALALIAFTHWLEAMRGYSDDSAQSMKNAAAYAEKSIELGDHDGFGHVVLGSVRLYEGKHDEAMALSERAVKVRNSCPLARAVHSNVLHFSGKHDLAIKNIKTAVKHARVYPPWMANVLSASYRDTGRLAPSIAIANECLRLNPEDLDGLVLLCTDYVLSDSLDEARKVAQKIQDVEPTFTISDYVETQPYRDKKTLQGMVEALRAAGLSE
jgi:class 3 adenylate cyclase/TolB-like protein